MSGQPEGTPKKGEEQKSPPVNAMPMMPWNMVATGWRQPAMAPYPPTQYQYQPPPSIPDAAVPPWKMAPSTNTSVPPRPKAMGGGIKFNVATTKTPIPVPPAAKAMQSIPTSTPPTRPNTNGQWPPSLRAYVDRCFSSCRNDADRDRTERALRTRIQEAIKTGNLYSYDWSLEPLLSIRAEIQPQTVVETKKDQRAKRFQSSEDQVGAKKAEEIRAKKVRSSALLALAEEGIDWDEFTIIGTCQNLEKPYLRLTSAPDPATVRPLPILRKTLEWLKKRWKEMKDYNFICDQFKSLRQDLTVHLCVQVYEIHARIALEKGDLGEYNQCQTQLVLLYESGFQGNSFEFLAYRILYLLHTRNRQEMSSLLTQLLPTQREHSAVKHALATRTALALSNHVAFFKLYRCAPNMGGYLMDYYVKRERLSALSTICRAYRPTVEISYVTDILAFENIGECLVFLQECNATLLEENTLLDTKASLLVFIS